MLFSHYIKNHLAHLIDVELSARLVDHDMSLGEAFAAVLGSLVQYLRKLGVRLNQPESPSWKPHKPRLTEKGDHPKNAEKPINTPS